MRNSSSHSRQRLYPRIYTDDSLDSSRLYCFERGSASAYQKQRGVEQAIDFVLESILDMYPFLVHSRVLNETTMCTLSFSLYLVDDSNTARFRLHTLNNVATELFRVLNRDYTPFITYVKIDTKEFKDELSIFIRYDKEGVEAFLVNVLEAPHTSRIHSADGPSNRNEITRSLLASTSIRQDRDLSKTSRKALILFLYIMAIAALVYLLIIANSGISKRELEKEDREYEGYM